MQDYYEPKVGERAPNFRLPSSDGESVTLEDLEGKNVILYFYPKDDTPGCTAEACSFRDRNDEIRRENGVVLGISTDPIESHRKFRAKHDLNFPLLSDETADVAKMFGAWKEKNFYGKRSWGVARMTYLIGPDGRIRKIWKKVDASKHGDEVLAELRSGGSGRKG
ncbi:MAG TPA: thioredoxin-dependent thiol peroxidase [Thermoanaerobaculia bacterium]|nr:thioredoxin-dependent thiol peroxidase [Thermoanaerobaculia bacterium]